MMQIPILSLAPMEGITTYIFRNALQKYYGGVDEYFSPFISAHKNKNLSNKELRDILPENNATLTLIPQILCGNAEDFLNTASQIAMLGYQHINLNFGCPSGTVTSKGKGSGILQDPHAMEQILDKIFSSTNLSISIKTRLGFDFYEEWEDLLAVYKKFPLKELIIHARVREDYYKGTAKYIYVKETLNEVQNLFPITYNGDIFSAGDAFHFIEELPGIHGLMMGRGFITNPALAKEIRNHFSNADASTFCHSLETFKAFHHEIVENYMAFLKDDRNTLFKIKELWPYMATLFPDSQKLLKQIVKCGTVREYLGILSRLPEFLY